MNDMDASLEYRAYSIFLRPGARERYLQYHADVWPEVEASLRRGGAEEYRIFLAGNDQLFSIIGFRPGCDMGALRVECEREARCRQWNEQMEQLQQPCPFAGKGEQWTELKMVYCLGGGGGAHA